jgi:hypothetical protein
MSNTLRRWKLMKLLLESLKTGPLGKRERQAKKVDISPEPRAPRRKLRQKIANKRLTLTSLLILLHLMDFLYTLNLKGTNELLDRLLRCNHTTITKTPKQMDEPKCKDVKNQIGMKNTW